MSVSDPQCMKWEPVSGIDNPCADISVAYEAGKDAKAVITMHFSRVRGLPARDLRLTFKDPIAIYWESESFGIKKLPGLLPRCSDPAWQNWVFPLLIVKNSEWLADYDARNEVGSKGRIHIAIVSMNDLVHLLAMPDVQAKWITGTEDNCSPV